MQRDQKKYFEVLRRYEKKFEVKELDDYKMLLIRHKDDEDLDRQSLERLKNLYEKYYVNREKKNYDDFFKKSEE
ncbi:MAG: hypothetical protein ACM3S2_09870 [Ignavibacteriales bacterium]